MKRNETECRGIGVSMSAPGHENRNDSNFQKINYESYQKVRGQIVKIADEPERLIRPRRDEDA
jgi:hypothetical protein